jgi:outer membrane protein assembly factor BamA
MYPDRYWGVGNDLPDISQGYTEDSFRWRNEVQRHVGAGLWTGVVHQGSVTRIHDEQDVVDADGRTVTLPSLLDASVLGRDGGLSNGLGLSLLHDNRDHVLVPTRGGYHYASLVVLHSAVGSDFDYLLWEVDLRRFLRLSADGAHVLGLQAVGEIRGRAPPFYELGKLGGPRRMRGYYEGRYRDQHYLTGQAEYRFPIYWRFAGVAFGAIGEVFGQDRLRLDRLRWCVGGGLRVRFGSDGIIRLDVGVGPDTEAVIIEGGHAF